MEGPLTRSQALASGWTPWQLRTGAVLRSVRDTYLPTDDCDLLARCRSVLLTLPPGALVSHWTAAALWGIDLPRIDVGPRIHAVVQRQDRPRHRTDRFVHESVLLARADAATIAGVAVTAPSRTWWDLATVLAAADLQAVTDQVLRRWCSRDQLGDMLLRHTGERGVIRARKALQHGDPRAESRMESVTRFRLIDAGLPKPEVQFVILDANGEVLARLDMAYPDLLIAIEFDGAVHREAEVFTRDLRRQNMLISRGWTVLRFSGSDVLSRPAIVVAQVRAALEKHSSR